VVEKTVEAVYRL